MLHRLARFAALACVLCAGQAMALGLGDINVKSKLNQPFSATIPVIGASPARDRLRSRWSWPAPRISPTPASSAPTIWSR